MGSFNRLVKCQLNRTNSRVRTLARLKFKIKILYIRITGVFACQTGASIRVSYWNKNRAQSAVHLLHITSVSPDGIFFFNFSESALISATFLEKDDLAPK